MPSIPQGRIPVREFQTPNFVDGFFTELVSLQDPNYEVPKRGTLYSTVSGSDDNSYPGGIVNQFPLLYFCREIRFKDSTTQALWLWSTSPTAEDTYNAEVSYMEENIDYPAYIRVYTIRRQIYDVTPALSTYSSLTGLIGVNITGGGAGYTQAMGTIGSASVTFVCFEGAVVSAIVTNEGASITSGGSLTIIGDGTGATATAIIQPAAAILTGQKKMEFPEDHPLRNEFVRVIRTYETLDGVIRLDWMQDQTTLLPKQITKQRIKTSEVAEPYPSVVGVNTSFKWISSVISEKTVETLDLTALEDYYAVLPARGTLNVPRVLTGLSVAWSTSNGSGSASETGSGSASGTSGNLNISSAVHSQGSASVIPELIPVWAPRWTEDQEFSDVIVFIASNAVTETQLITALSAALTSFLGTATTVNAWPSFGAVETSFVLIGQKVSVAAGATARASASWSISDGSVSNSYMLSDGTESSKDFGDTIRPQTLPLNIHGDLLFGDSATNSETVSASAASAQDIGGGASNSVTVTETASGSVSPVGIYETTPAGLPSSGWYLYRPDASLHESGTMMIRGRLYNFANYPSAA